jgi:hypothetical protein
MAKWIDFCELIPDPNKPLAKTKRWGVYPKNSGDKLGMVAWFGRWRKYCFHPWTATVYEQDCLRDIAQFCEDQTKQHNDTRKAERLARAGN